MSFLPEKREATVPATSTVASLRDYLIKGHENINYSARLVSDLYLCKGIGKHFVRETNNILYHYSEDPINHVFSRGGRLILIINKAALPISKHLTKILHDRFVTLNTQSDAVLIRHFDELIKLSSYRNINSKIVDLVGGVFTVHMYDMVHPFIEIGKNDPDILVVPLPLISELALNNVWINTVIVYMNQHILVATNQDYTIRVLYASHLLDKCLFHDD